MLQYIIKYSGIKMKAKKKFSDEDVDALIRIRYGQLTSDSRRPAFVSYWQLGMLMRTSLWSVRKHMLARMAELPGGNLDVSPERRDPS